jgi:hypothetical protein
MERRNGGHQIIWEQGPLVGRLAMRAGGASNRTIYTRITVFRSTGFISSVQALSTRQILVCDTTLKVSYPETVKLNA